MFAARADQENLAYAHQTAAVAAAAAKPLNQAKTPSNKAPKTPFRRNQNDENDDFQSGFKTGKTNKKSNENAFVTPAGPRTRAPLGMKTTNAKARSPAPLTNAKPSGQKTVSPRLRRPKVKIHQAEPVLQEVGHGVPDIEYMAPRSIPLPDHPDTIHNQEWSMLKPENLSNGFWGAFENAADENGERPMERKNRQMMARTDKMQEDIIRRALEADDFLNLDLAKARREIEKKQTQTRAPSTVSSKRAASALSRPASSASTAAPARAPRFAAPTTTASAPFRSMAPPSRNPSSTLLAPTAASSRHATAAAASRNTLGYSKGRAVSATTRRPLSADNDTKPSSPIEKKTRTVLENLMADDAELEQLAHEKQSESEDQDAAVDTLASLSDHDDQYDEFADFQLNL